MPICQRLVWERCGTFGMFAARRARKKLDKAPAAWYTDIKKPLPQRRTLCAALTCMAGGVALRLCGTAKKERQERTMRQQGHRRLGQRLASLLVSGAMLLALLPSGGGVSICD